MRKWLKKRKALVAVVGLALVGLAVFAITGQGDEAEETTTYTTEQAETGTLTVTVSGSGNALAQTTEVWPDTAGEVVTVEVSEGETVSAGDVLYTLASDDLDDETSRLLASYQQARESYERAQLSVTQAEDGLGDVDSDADRAYTAYLQAQQSYERAVIEVEDAQAAYDDALAGSQLPTPTATSEDVERLKKQLEIAELGLESAQVSRDSAWTDHQDAVSDSADDVAQQNVTVAELGLASSASSLENARSDYDQAIAEYNGLVVTAPHDGVVESLDIDAGDALSAGGSGSSGDSAGTADAAGASSDVPLVLTSNDPLSVDIEVNEVDMPGLEVGQKAEVIFDAMPDLTFAGEVASMDSEGTNTQGVVTYFVSIDLHTVHEDLRAGMTVNATIVTAVEQDVLLVPNAAVNTDSSTESEYVEVLEAGTTEPRIVPVETGLYSATHTIVESGLDAGDPVVTATNTSSGEDEEEAAGIMMPGMGGGPGR